VRYTGMSLLLGLFVVVSTTVVGAQADAPAEFPEAEAIAVDGTAVDGLLAGVGLDASWRSVLDLHPAARNLTVEYRLDEGDTVAALPTTAVRLGNVTTEREAVIAELRIAATNLDAARDEERAREIDRNRTEAHFERMHALTQAAAVRVFAGTDHTIDAVLGLDGEALTAAQREFLITNATLDELFEMRRTAETEFELAVAVLEAAVRHRIDTEDRHAVLVDDAAALTTERQALDGLVRSLLPDAAAAYSLPHINGQPGLTPRALNA
jgi:hypothetical protein